MSPAIWVWLVWAATTLVALAYAWTYGRRFPYSDDWDTLVPVLIGQRAVSLHWLWSQQNEHRLPLLRLGQLVSVKLMHGDFRAPILLGIALLSAAAAALIGFVRTWRGATALVDLCIPLALLRLNNSSFGWGGQVHFIATTVLAIGVLRWGASPALLLLPLCGASGLVIALPFALLFGYRALRSPERENASPMRVAVVLLTIGLIALYFVGWQKPVQEWATPSITTTLTMTARYLGAAANPSFTPVWPLDAILIAMWTALVGYALVRAWRVTPSERTTTLALFLGLELLLALVLGRARGGRGWLPDLGYNYASLALGLLAALVTATLVATPPAGRRAMSALLLLLMGAPYLITTTLAFCSPEVEKKRDEERVLADELLAGVSAEELATRHAALLAPAGTPETHAFVVEGLRWLATSSR